LISLLKYNIDTQNFRIHLKQFRTAYLPIYIQYIQTNNGTYRFVKYVKYNTYDFEITTAIIYFCQTATACQRRGREKLPPKAVITCNSVAGETTRDGAVMLNKPSL